MSEWLQRQASSHTVQLALTAVVGGLVVGSSILGVQAWRREAAANDLKASIPSLREDDNNHTIPSYHRVDLASLSKEDAHAAKLARRAQKGDYDQELIDEQLTRTSSFLKPEGLARLRSAFVVVVGLGGVGSHCTAALARSGVARIRVIDFDQVTLSSLNRHAVATLADVGTPKVQCVKRRLEAAVPWVQWETLNEIWKEQDAERLLGPFGSSAGGPQPDYVVDAIDNIDSKVALLHYCHSRNIKVVSAMGAGCKSDPTRIMIGDISATIEDPLAKATRRRLKLRGVSQGIQVAYSTEKPGPGKAQLLPLPDEEYEKGSVRDLSVLPDFRVRILPVLGTMPAMFGYVLANLVIMELSHYPHELGLGKARSKLYDSIYGTLLSLEERLARTEGEDSIGLRMALSPEDVGFLVDEVFRGKSVISGLPTRLVLIRWRASERYHANSSPKGQKLSTLRIEDLVCMTKEEAAIHEKQVLLERTAPETVYSKDIVAHVRSRFREEEEYVQYR